MNEPVTLPCPCCGAEPLHGQMKDGKQIYYCDDHLHINTSGDTLEEAAVNWNRQNWSDVMDSEFDPEEDLIEQQND